MKKIMNDKHHYVEDSLAGILMAYPQLLKSDPSDIRAIYATNSPVSGKVAIVTGGGYGHLPTFLGYVGIGLCDGVAVGNVFTSPSFDTIWNVTQRVVSTSGVLFLYGNYMGDSLNFDMAAEIAELEEIPTATVRVCDDVASSKKRIERRGIAGIFFAYKIAGACAQRMASLEEVRRVAEKTVKYTSSYGVALSSCSLPSADHPIFEIGADDMEIGMGIHGEPGIRRGKILTSSELVETLMPELIKDQDLQAGDRIALLINGLGASAYEELYILYKDAVEYLQNMRISVTRSFVGEYATSMEMAGASITILRLDDELLTLLDDPAHSPFILFR